MRRQEESDEQRKASSITQNSLSEGKHMPDDEQSASHERDVAKWHKLSATPDDVTDQGVVVHVDPGQKLRAEKQALRATAQRLAHGDAPYEVRTMARLAASYLLAGDVETASRYLDQAERMLQEPPRSDD